MYLSPTGALYLINVPLLATQQIIEIFSPHLVMTKVLIIIIIIVFIFQRSWRQATGTLSLQNYLGLTSEGTGGTNRKWLSINDDYNDYNNDDDDYDEYDNAYDD